MKHIVLFISMMLCFGFQAFAQADGLKRANEMYARGNYPEAAKQYEEVIAREGVAPELYFNLGNAYFKANEIGRSILNYERALRLSPSYDDARYNMEMAQQRVVDNIAASQTFFLGRWIGNLIKLLTSNQWVYFSFGLFVLLLVFAFLFVFGPTRSFRRASFYAGTFFLVACFFTVLFAGIRKNQMLNHDEAIVMTGVVIVKSSPDKSGTDLFQLHEGTKVTIKSTLGEWTEIVLGNGSVGWVGQENVERI
ncbi:MAG TPA: tetratricopeptide repeat protein [Paludibacter sp.]|nr:tetratricopeptide repeat protein [Paludibacter sp.]